jgi:hypothetical protein
VSEARHRGPAQSRYSSEERDGVRIESSLDPVRSQPDAEADIRTVEEIRSRRIESLKGALERPLIWGGAAFGAELLIRSIIHDLLFIDERESDCLRDVRYELSNEMHLLPFRKRWIEVVEAA